MGVYNKSYLKNKNRKFDNILDSYVNRVDDDASSNYNIRKGYNRYFLEEYFSQTPGVNADLASGTESTRVPRNRHFEILGTNGTSALATFDHEYSGVTLTTDTADNDQMIIVPHLDTKQSAWAVAGMWDSHKEVDWSAAITTGGTITTYSIWAGLKLTNTPVYATDTDQAYFISGTDDDHGAFTTNGNLHCVVSSGGTDYITDLGIAIAANTTYHLKLSIDSNLKVSAFVNGSQYSLTSATTAGGVTTGTGTDKSPAIATNKALIPYIGVMSHTGARALRVHHQKASCKLVA